MQSLVENIMGKLAISEMMLFDETIKQVENNWRSCRCLQMVSIHKFRIYKAVSRPRVDKSSEQDFIKVILIKDQGRSKGNKE